MADTDTGRMRLFSRKYSLPSTTAKLKFRTSGVGGQITRFFLLKIIQIYGLYLTLDMTNSGSQQRFQTLTLVGIQAVSIP